tara:strand:- start:2857 stop:3621 length:765 start_codon:yes stop_codon:yes gene_type:complete
MKIAGSAAVVTGGASGLGEATVRLLANAGARVSILDLNETQGTRLAEICEGRFFNVDVTNETDVRGALESAEKAHGVARILVNCAGMAPPAKVLERAGTAMPLDAFSKTLSVNLLGTFNVLSKFSERLHKADLVNNEERGVIINTASIAAFDGQIGQSAYAASKGGIVSMTLPIARELARYGIRVMAIAPGLFLTPLLSGLPQNAQDSLGAQVPFPSRLGRPEEFASLVESIISNPMLNGEVIRIDGAIRMAPR